jgi:hypothetical protein
VGGGDAADKGGPGVVESELMGLTKGRKGRGRGVGTGGRVRKDCKKDGHVRGVR